MYGWLQSFERENGIQMRSITPAWNFLSLLRCMASAPQWEQRMDDVLRFSGLAIPPELAVEHPTPTALALMVDDDLLEYASLMFAAHYRLPEAQRSQRESQIDLAFRRYLGEDEDNWPDWSVLMKGMALILPNASIDSTIGAWLTQLPAAVAVSPDLGLQTPSGFSELMARLDQQSALAHPPAIRAVFALVLASRTRAQREQWLARLPRLNRARPAGVQRATACYYRHVSGRDLTMTHWYGLNALASVLESIHPEAPEDEWEERVQQELSLAEMAHGAQSMQICLASMDAVSAGVNLGPNTQSSRLAMETYNRYWTNQFARVDDAAHRLVQRAALPVDSADLDPTDAPIDRDSLQSWTIDQLVEWIEGPLPSQAGPVNREHVMAQARRARRRIAPPASHPPGMATPRSPGPADTDDDLSPQAVDRLVRDALANTARYFRGELGDLKKLTQQMAVPSALKTEVISTCDRLSQSLEATEQRDPSLPEQVARGLLHTAEQEIPRLRQHITQAHAQVRLDSRFTQALSAALTREPLSLGKRTGGTVNCPVAFSQWQAICDGFHHRWLPSARQVLVNGAPVALQPDQALALYVTGSSLSGYAFDVSVHLWRRRPGRDSQPSQDTGLFPPMNTQDWFDTYQTCCVLHVPHAPQARQN